MERVLHVRVVEGRNLPVADPNGRSDPYCIVKLKKKGRIYEPSKSAMRKKLKLSGKRKTQAVLRSLNPVWNEDFSFVYKSSTEEYLVVKVYDYDRVGQDDFLGKIRIPLADLADGGGGTHRWYRLRDKNMKEATRGEVNIKIHADLFPSDFTDRHPSKADALAALADRRQRTLLWVSDLEKHAKKNSVVVSVSTWNVGNAAPPDRLDAMLPRTTEEGQPIDLFVVGAQECRYDNDKTYVDVLLRTVGEDDYTVAQVINLWEMRLVLLVRREAQHHLRDIQTSKEATGIAHVMGNKGAVAVSCQWDHTSFCFVNSHLAAHQNKITARNADVKEIIQGIGTVGFSQYGDVDVLNQFDHVVWLGDLNYRLDFIGGAVDDSAVTVAASDSEPPSRRGSIGATIGMLDKSPTLDQFAKIMSYIDQRRFPALFRYDQLTKQRIAQQVFVGWHEGAPDFPPTFKHMRGTVDLKYDEQRSPAWTDRVLWLPAPGCEGDVQQVALTGAVSITTSDHKPVTSHFQFVTHELPSCSDASRGAAYLRFTTMEVALTAATNQRERVQQRGSVFYLDETKAGTGALFVKISSESLVESVSSAPRPGPRPSWRPDDDLEVTLLHNSKERLARTHILLRVYRGGGLGGLVGIAMVSLDALAAVPGIAEIEEAEHKKLTDDDDDVLPPRVVWQRVGFAFEAALTLHGQMVGTVRGDVQMRWDEREGANASALAGRTRSYLAGDDGRVTYVSCLEMTQAQTEVVRQLSGQRRNSTFSTSPPANSTLLSTRQFTFRHLVGAPLELKWLGRGRSRRGSRSQSKDGPDKKTVKRRSKSVKAAPRATSSNAVGNRRRVQRTASALTGLSSTSDAESLPQGSASRRRLRRSSSSVGDMRPHHRPQQPSLLRVPVMPNIDEEDSDD